MLLKSVAFFSVLGILAQSIPAPVKVLPFVDSSLPVKFREYIAEAAPSVPSNLATYQYALDFGGTLVSLTGFQCLKQAGYSVVFVRANDPNGQGSFDQNSCYTIQNAYHAGIGVEIYMTPQPRSNKQGYQQLDEIYQGLTSNGITIRAIWIQVVSPANWMNPTNNINFINSIASRARQYGMAIGVFTSYCDWNHITNGWTGLGSDVLLWYSNVHGEGANGETPANFDDFRPFGRWTAPTAKQFARFETVCQIRINRDVFHAGTMLKASDAVEKDGKIYAGGFIHEN